MIESLRQRAWRRVNVTFPERQIYIRSDGRVQFFTFTSQMQAVFACAGLLFLGWVAFTSVNVIFKDRILAAKEHHFDQMQSFYEGRIADLQLSYDELNSALIVAQDSFRTIADSFEAKQQVLAAVIDRKKTLQTSLGIGVTGPKDRAANQKTTRNPSFGSGGVGGAFDTVAPASAAALAPPFASGVGQTTESALPASQQQHEAVPIPRSAPRAGQPTFLKGAVQKLGSLFHRTVSVNTTNPVIKESSAQSARIVRLELVETALLAEATQDLNKETTRLTRALRATGIDSKKLMTRVTANRAQGGPLIPLDAGDMSDDGFSANIAEAAGAMGRLDDVVAALNAVPLITPTEVGGVSSGYGARLDPFNENLAFHSGIDFSGPLGADVRLTAPGVVVFAGPRGAYGNTVEVDHGYGVRTRYGHLSKIVAQVGSRLDKGSVVGRLGSTGRSTGPHVHYEIWFDDAVRDPGKFIKAGHDVLQK